MKHARNYIDCDLDFGIVWCVTKVVAQQKLGLLPEWRTGTGLVIVVILLVLGRI